MSNQCILPQTEMLDWEQPSRHDANGRGSMKGRARYVPLIVGDFAPGSCHELYLAERGAELTNYALCQLASLLSSLSVWP